VPPESRIVKRQIGVKVSKFLVVSGALPTGHVIQRMRNGNGLGHVTPKIFGIRLNVSSKLRELETLNLVYSFLLEKLSGRANNFPQKGRGLGHVTPSIFGIQSNISSKLLELETSNLAHSFNWGKPGGRSNNFPPNGRGLGHVTHKFFGIHSNLSSKLLKLETLNLVFMQLPLGKALWVRQ